jgi:glutamine cyclotransferase
LLLPICTASCAAHQADTLDTVFAYGCSASSVASQQRATSRQQGVSAGTDRLEETGKREVLSTARHYGYRVVNRYPHDSSAFTQGLVFHNQRLYESTGLKGESTLREVDLKSGKVLTQIRLDENVFGEGLALVGQHFVQLTWRAGVGYIYRADNLQRLEQFGFSGEGWGSTSIDETLVVSNGTEVLTWMDSDSYRVSATLTVREGEQPIQGLNELEYVEGKILANVWPSDCIAEIDRHSGQVTGWIDLSGLYPPSERRHWAAISNGIAYNKHRKRLFVTGKYWPYVYEIELLAHTAVQ